MNFLKIANLEVKSPSLRGATFGAIPVSAFSQGSTSEALRETSEKPTFFSRSVGNEHCRRGIVGVKGVTGRDATDHKRRRNSSHEELVAKHPPCFAAFEA